MPIYNQRFGVEPEKKLNLHRPVPEGLNLNDILCKRIERTLKKDFTISYEKRLYQIKDRIRTKRVTVLEHISGTISIRHKGKTLDYSEIINRPKRLADKEKPKTKRIYIPPKDHPWRKFNMRSYPQYAQY